MSRPTQEASRSWKSFAFPGLVLALGMGFALLPLARGKFFFYWDNAQQHFPQTVFLHTALRAGHIPQWWPQVGLGFPATAEGQAAHYHPIRLLLAWIFSPPVSFMLEIGLYLAVAGLSTYFFLREFRLRRPACFVGAVCQMFGSFSVVFIKNMALHRSLCLLPLAMLYAERFARRRRLTAGLATSLIVGLQFVAGHPTFAVVTIVATTVYLLLRVLQQGWHRQEPVGQVTGQLLRVTSQWGLAVALGFGIGAIQVLPTLLSTRESIRQGGLSFEYATNVLAARAEGMPQLLFPYAYLQGDWRPTPTWWGSYFNLVPYTGIYVGTLAMLLAVLGLWWRRRWPDPGIPLSVCFLVATALALGSKTPLFPALWDLPGMNQLRYPHRFLMWASFCLACLAALGLHRLLARSRLRQLRLRGSVPFLFLVVVDVGLGWWFWVRRPAFHLGVLMCWVLFALATCLTLAFLFLHRRHQGYLIFLVMFFVFADLWLFRAWSGYAPTVSIREAQAPPPVSEFLKSDRSQFRVMSLVSLESGSNRTEDLREFLQADLCTLWGIESADVWLSLILKRYYAVREGIVWELLNSPDSAQKLAGFLGALNVKYAIAPVSVHLRDWEKVYESARAATWKNPAVLPRAYLVGQVIPEPVAIHPEWVEGSARRLEAYREMLSKWGPRIADAQIVDQILSHPIDYRTTAVVAGETLPELSGHDPESTVLEKTGHSDVLKYEVESRKPALLVISNSWYPGWTAIVNGHATRIYRTNWISLGIAVPAGKSEIMLRFVAPGFRLGSIVSLISIGLLLAGFVIAGKAGQRTEIPALERVNAEGF